MDKVRKPSKVSTFRVKEQVKKNQHEADSGFCLLPVPCWSNYSTLEMKTETSVEYMALYPLTVIVRAFGDLFIVFWS
jgi:hypothetical protein